MLKQLANFYLILSPTMYPELDEIHLLYFFCLHCLLQMCVYIYSKRINLSLRLAAFNNIKINSQLKSKILNLENFKYTIVDAFPEIRSLFLLATLCVLKNVPVLPLLLSILTSSKHIGLHIGIIHCLPLRVTHHLSVLCLIVIYKYTSNNAVLINITKLMTPCDHSCLNRKMI